MDMVFAVLRGTPAPRGLPPEPGSHVLALDSATGRPRWPHPVEAPRIQQWIATDQAVYVVHRPGAVGRFAAFDVGTGTLLWDHSLPAGASTAPVVADDMVYLNGGDGSVYAAQVGTGRAPWTMRLGRRITAPVVSHGLVLVGSWDPHRLTALDARTGKPVWSKTGSGAFASAPMVVGSTVWAAHRAGVLQGWDVTAGRQQGARYEDLLWDPALQGEPAVHDGILYVTTRRGDLRCLSLH
jgi:outer membrane protein assembly factor BamB